MKTRKTISVRHAQAFDKLAQDKLGVPSLILMENAGRSVAEEALKMLRGKKRAAVVCGSGNNGGDGLVAARHLLNAGVKVKVYLLGDASKLKTDPQINLNILKQMKQKIGKSLRKIEKTDLIIDAIFGIGLTSEVRKPYLSVIKYLNQTKIPVLSVDVPSGLNADTGEVLGATVKAKKTVTFIASKHGFYKADGPKYCGKIIVRNIGIAF
jgi:NAD(P)H-hydrate epimerase